MSERSRAPMTRRRFRSGRHTDSGIAILDQEPARDPGEESLAGDPSSDDLATQLAARPPRAKLPWATLVLVAAVVGVGGFIAGAKVQDTAGTTPATIPTGITAGAARGGAAGGAGAVGGADGQGGDPAGAMGGNATIGTVKLVDGDTVYITDMSGNTVKVTTTGETSVQTTSEGSVQDLTAGSTVVVRGETAADGSVAASSVSEGGLGSGAGAPPGAGAPSGTGPGE